MADWSQLPPEILTLIAKRLETRIDVLRFRSVCSSWRYSCKPKVHPLPKWLPSNTRGTFTYSFGAITTDTLYLVRLPGDNHCCWVVNTREYTNSVKMGFLKPLSDHELKPLPLKFPKVWDLTNFQVIELGHQFVVRYNSGHFNYSFELRDKAAFLWSNTNSNDFVMLTVYDSIALELAFSRSGQIQSTLLEDVNDVHDIISFNGKFYVVEHIGRTIVIDQSLNVSFLQHVGSPNSKKFLVRSGDNLLVVEQLFLTSSSDSDAQAPAISVSTVSHKVVRFRIFRLDEEAQKWDEMDSLGDQILFLGLHHSISASASEFFWSKGNLIFYNSGLCMSPYYEPILAFDLDTGAAVHIENCPAYRNLFRSPPAWATSSESVISSREVISNTAYSVTSATPPGVENMYPDSSSTISTGENRGKSPTRVTSAGQRPSPSSKCSFKFCCF